MFLSKILVYSNYKEYIQWSSLDSRNSYFTRIFFGISFIGCIRIISSGNVVVATTRIISINNDKAGILAGRGTCGAFEVCWPHRGISSIQHRTQLNVCYIMILLVYCWYLSIALFFLFTLVVESCRQHFIV